MQLLDCNAIMYTGFQVHATSLICWEDWDCCAIIMAVFDSNKENFVFQKILKDKEWIKIF